MRTFIAVAGIAAALTVGAGQAAAAPLPLVAPTPIATSGPVGLPPQTSQPYTGSSQSTPSGSGGANTAPTCGLGCVLTG
ncbi:hypothetical protein ACFXPR_12585 [Nocardia tengchongensis]|uniref:hypothetical protein n=1 Tax=Nocardia tengchongensis TaxID=2055889 RepID=UPI00369066A3